jgi:outer membrane protein OmpA-like peptidoglycan-associated protein
VRSRRSRSELSTNIFVNNHSGIYKVVDLSDNTTFESTKEMLKNGLEHDLDRILTKLSVGDQVKVPLETHGDLSATTTGRSHSRDEDNIL